MPEEEIDIIEKLKEDPATKIQRRIRHQNFAKTIIFICENFKRYGVVHVVDLADFLSVDMSYAYRILRQFVSLGLVNMRRLGTLTEFTPVYNNGEMVIMKWYDEAKKTLNLT